MFSFRSCIRRLFGISIPGVDELTESDVVIHDLFLSLREAEDEAKKYKDLLLDSIDMNDNYRYGIVKAITVLMETIDVKNVVLKYEDDDEEECEEDEEDN